MPDPTVYPYMHLPPVDRQRLACVDIYDEVKAMLGFFPADERDAIGRLLVDRICGIGSDTSLTGAR